MFDVEDYRTIEEEEGPQALRLASILNDLYNPHSITDAGCATGLYLKPFFDNGRVILGLENSDDALKHALVPNIYKCDLTQVLVAPVSDLAICLEVAEHIEENFSTVLVRNLCSMSDKIIFSAAMPGQGGNGHINCQPKSYWEDLFVQQGFSRNHGHENIVINYMKQGYHMGWLTQNLMIFHKTH